MIDNTLQMLDDAFADYIAKRSNANTLTTKIGRICTALPFDNGSKHFEASIVNQNRKESFFGMRIYPIYNGMTNILNGLVNSAISFKDLCKRWKSITNWYIEIDAQLLDRHALNFVPKEFTAMLLHEIGHTIYSERPIEMFYRAYQEAKARMQLADRASMKVMYSLYTVPLGVACAQKFWVTSKNQLNIEIYADKTLLDTGYAKYLASALNKIVQAYGTVDDPDSVKENRIKESVNWANVNISDVVRRKEKLKDELYYRSVKTESNFIKAMCIKLLNDLGVRMRERYSGSVVECTLDLCIPGALESYTLEYAPEAAAQLVNAVRLARSGDLEFLALESFRGKKIKFPTQYDLDCISIEIDKITSNHDRIFVLDLIAKIEEDITTFEELYANQPDMINKYQKRIEDFRRQLADMRKVVLAKRNFNKQYKFFVKVPEGYEG